MKCQRLCGFVRLLHMPASIRGASNRNRKWRQCSNFGNYGDFLGACFLRRPISGQPYAAQDLIVSHGSQHNITMKPTPFYFFEYTAPGARKPKRTTWRMTIEQAAQQLPGATPIMETEEIRDLPEPGEPVYGLGFLATAAPGFKQWAPPDLPLDPQNAKNPPSPK